MIGGFIAPIVRRITPRAALLGTLAGVSIAFISMRPAFEIAVHHRPLIGITCFAIILVSWFGGIKYPKSIPAGLIAILVGCAIAWGSNLFGLGIGGMSLAKLTGGVQQPRLLGTDPQPPIDAFSGFEFLGIILVTAIPFGVYDLVEAMDNVESAEAAGDAFPTTRVLTADGVVSLIGCADGQPVHQRGLHRPSRLEGDGRTHRLFRRYRADGDPCCRWFADRLRPARSSYPVVAISPILLYIGMLIGAQAFQTTPQSHAPAIALCVDAASRGLGQEGGDRRRAHRSGHQRSASRPR